MVCTSWFIELFKIDYQLLFFSYQNYYYQKWNHLVLKITNPHSSQTLNGSKRHSGTLWVPCLVKQGWQKFGKTCISHRSNIQQFTLLFFTGFHFSFNIIHIFCNCLKNKNRARLKETYYICSRKLLINDNMNKHLVTIHVGLQHTEYSKQFPYGLQKEFTTAPIPRAIDSRKLSFGTFFFISS